MLLLGFAAAAVLFTVNLFAFLLLLLLLALLFLSTLFTSPLLLASIRGNSALCDLVAAARHVEREIKENIFGLKLRENKII